MPLFRKLLSVPKAASVGKKKSGAFGPVTGQQAFTTSGTYTWVAPSGVTKVSIVAVGGGGGGSVGGNTYWGGGALAWRNNLTIIPGNSYTVYVGVGGTNAAGGSTYSSDISATTTANGGGTGTQGESCFTGEGGGKGGKKGNNAGGGAGGYSGQGGQGGDTCGAGYAGTGGAAGGGGGGRVNNDYTCRRVYWGAGGGVGLLGSGANGAAGTAGGTTGVGGGGGSGGCNGGTTSNYLSPANGGAYGGAGGTSVRQLGPYVCCQWASTTYYYGSGMNGAFRIIWPGCARSFPSTRTADE
jgi:hypothetical protein